MFNFIDAVNGFSFTSSTDEPVEMDDIILTCKASVFNFTSLELTWQFFDNKKLHENNTGNYRLLN